MEAALGRQRLPSPDQGTQTLTTRIRLGSRALPATDGTAFRLCGVSRWVSAAFLRRGRASGAGPTGKCLPALPVCA